MEKQNVTIDFQKRREEHVMLHKNKINDRIVELTAQAENAVEPEKGLLLNRIKQQNRLLEAIDKLVSVNSNKPD